MDDVRMVEVYRARDSTHAHLLRDQLEEVGIPTLIEGMQLQSALGGLPTGWAVAPRLVVEAHHVDQARALLEQLEALGRSGDDSESPLPAHSSESHTAPTPTLTPAEAAIVEEQSASARHTTEPLVVTTTPTTTRRPAGSPLGILRWYGHALGIFTILWAITSWVEWFSMWIDFAFLSPLFMFGCLWLTLQMLLFPMPLNWRSRLIYAAFPVSYLLSVLSQLVSG
jgi:hypothetical protein